ncbi:MAG: hypothetical protein HOE76_00055 [Euryarchaeota archaeon]|jgi:hypothetical protein|nr:hypothetical protein [Euryarchaeota archaeon]MBT4982063.1 hypothetical protein [Euryarchaeota archaeon]MBT5184092.1 hypothetical protein [Euryarchaeota archaeon]
MSNDGENAEDDLLSILTMPSRTLANWYFWLGCLGLMLAILNLVGQIHPSYHVSWGGLLTFETWNATFGHKDTAAAFVLGDAIFMLGCLFFVGTGARSLAGDDGIGNWIMSMVKSEWYLDLIEPKEGGWSLILGTWSMLVSIVFYFYWGIIHMAWIDPGVYSIAISVMAVGLVLRMLSTIENEE